MSEKNEKDPASKKKKLKLSKEVIENLKDEDLEQVVGGLGVPPNQTPGELE